MAFHREHPAGQQQAHAEIKRRILSLELEPTSSLAEQRLAQELHVSRTPIRETLVRLAAEGLVELIPNRGAFVAPIRTDAVLGAQFVREALEIALGKEAAQRIDEYGELQLCQAIEEQKLANRQTRPDLFYLADERMHRIIAQIANKPMVWQHVLEAKVHLDRVRQLNLQGSESYSNLIEQHEAIIEAILKQDDRAITDCFQQHLRQVLPDLESLKQQYPQYFR